MKIVHRLVAETYLPNPNKLMEVNHIDGNKVNNIYISDSKRSLIDS
jgi:hypothetical protein